MIRDVAAFQACLLKAIDAANDGKLVTFGITPTGPETGFGYIKTAANLNGLHKADHFTEKPDAATAEAFLREGGWFWNSGMFVWRASGIMCAVEEALPALGGVDGRYPLIALCKTAGLVNVCCESTFCPSACDFDRQRRASWRNPTTCTSSWQASAGRIVGSWDAVFDIADKDASGVAPTGQCHHRLQRHTDSGQQRLIAAIGLEGISVIETADAVLIARRGSSQKVKDVVDQLAKRSAREHIEHTTVQRPWGATMPFLRRAQVSRSADIEVKPGGRLSMQSHKFRSEHWVVVAGEATVTCDGKVTLLTKNQSTYIPIRLKASPGEPRATLHLHIIETQVGEYAGEDDTPVA